MQAPIISVVIPVYNSIETLPRALGSIASQTLKPAEILICNDGSSNPDVATYLNALGTHYEGIPLRVFHQTNAGAGAARNRCIAASTGEFIAFLDADDWWLPQKLERSLDVLIRSNALFIAHNFHAVKPDGTEEFWDCTAISQRRDAINPRGNPRTQYFYRGFIGILTVVIRREALLAAGGFDSANRYALDWDCWHAVLAATPHEEPGFIMFPESLARYTLSPGGLTSKSMARIAQRESYLPRYAKGVARAGGVFWPLLLTRGWLTIQYETVSPLLRRKQVDQVAYVVLRAPFRWCQLLWQTATSRYQRPDFLARVS